MTNTASTDLGLTDISANAPVEGDSCCGGGGCGSSADNSNELVVAAAASATSESVITELQVAGMTCGHCVTSVTRELSALDGVSGVEVALVANGVSTVTVQSATVLNGDAVAAAIDEAGYALA